MASKPTVRAEVPVTKGGLACGTPRMARDPVRRVTRARLIYPMSPQGGEAVAVQFAGRRQGGRARYRNQVSVDQVARRVACQSRPVDFSLHGREWLHAACGTDYRPA